MAIPEPLEFSMLVHQVADTLETGAVLFDCRLQILDVTSAAHKMLYAEPSIDAALSRGTEKTIGRQWKTLLESSLNLKQKAFYGKVPYWMENRKQLLDMTCIPLTGSEGQILGGVMILSNVTEKQDTEYETAQSDRFMAIGRVAGKVAHELNNPLDGILRYVNLSLRMLEQGQAEKAAEYMQHCRSGLQRMTQIITEMLEFSRSRHFSLEASPLDKLLDEALRALDGSLKTIDVKIIRNESSPLPHYKGDAMFQVFCNLIKNAADAMNGTGTLTITFSRRQTQWQIDLQDTGPGFAPHQADDLFQPFFTTKAPGRGTGLGLSICKDILEKFGGQIIARNLPEGGACFSIYLPAADISTMTRS